MMNRCGINAFELAADIDLATFRTALGELSGLTNQRLTKIVVRFGRAGSNYSTLPCST